jgi:ketosteroid isomerase-like protein
MAPVARGRAAFERVFRRLFTLLPDLSLTVTHWAARGDVVYVESTCSGSLGGKPLAFPVCDRFVLSGGLIAERHAYFDPTPIVRAVVTRPRAWPHVLRALFQRQR